MKISKSLLFALLMLSLTSLASAQGGSISFGYANDPGNPPLGYPCTGNRTAFTDGTIVTIFWDRNGNGPDATDTLPDPSGVNFNTFTFNAGNWGFPDGYFLTDPYFTVNELPVPPIYYLQISRTSAPAVCLVSDTIRMVPGAQDWNMTSANWHCVDHACTVSDTTHPAAPTNFTASLDLYCLSVRATWHHDLLHVSGFNVYYGAGNFAAAVGPTDTVATFGVITDSVRNYYVRAYNLAGESAPSDTAPGSTFLRRFANDTTTNVHGFNLHGQPFSVHLLAPAGDSIVCPAGIQLYLLHDTSPNHQGVYQRFGSGPLCTDSLTDTLNCVLPDDSTINFCRVLMLDSAFNAFGHIVIFSDTTDSVFHLGHPGVSTQTRTLTLPDHFDLAQNFPNPFNPTTEIQFSVPMRAEIRIKVYNVMGQLVRTLAQGSYDVGIHRITWDGKSDQGLDVSSGVYLYRMEGPKFVQVKKMLLMK